MIQGGGQMSFFPFCLYFFQKQVRVKRNATTRNTNIWKQIKRNENIQNSWMGNLLLFITVIVIIIITIIVVIIMIIVILIFIAVAQFLGL